MKKTFALVVALALFVGISSAQKLPGKSAAAAGGGASGVAAGGVGMTWIDGQAYYLVNVAPEIAFGKFGAGLDLNLYVSSKDQSIRWQELQRGRFIRYIRYGNKGDEFYIRLGMLDYARLGHGFILYNYKNSPSTDNRHIGTELDVDFGKWGLETVYGDVTNASVLGARGYVRPLQFTPLASIPVIGGLEVGAVYAGDMRSNSKDVAIDTAGGVTKQKNDGAISAVGLDLGLPLLRLPVINLTYYFDYATILNFGHGFATGIEANSSLFGLVNLSAKFERRFGQTDQFLPTYFDGIYEIERYKIVKNAAKLDTLDSKAKKLSNTKSPGSGYFGSLMVDVLGTIQVEGSYQKLDAVPNSGILHLGTSTGDKIPLIQAKAGYDRFNIGSNSDIFKKPDENCLLYAELGYKPYPFMTVSMMYTWTFAPEKDKDGNVIGYQPQKRVTPKVGFSFPL